MTNCYSLRCGSRWPSFFAVSALLVSVGCTIGPGKFELVSSMQDGRGFYVDKRSIVAEGSIRRFRLVINLPSSSPDGTRSRLSFEEADCSVLRSRSLEESIFDGEIASGKVMRESKIPSDWFSESEGSPMHAVVKFVCTAK